MQSAYCNIFKSVRLQPPHCNMNDIAVRTHCNIILHHLSPHTATLKKNMWFVIELVFLPQQRELPLATSRSHDILQWNCFPPKVSERTALQSLWRQKRLWRQRAKVNCALQIRPPYYHISTFFFSLFFSFLILMIYYQRPSASLNIQFCHSARLAL